MDRKTIEAYDRTADVYEGRTADYWARTPKPPFIDTFTDALTGPLVLDVGSGPGRDAFIFRERGLRAVCLDASAAMVALCAKKGLVSVRGDFAHLPFATASFDGVWAYTSLLHVPKADVGGPLDEIRRVLKPEGVLGLGLYEGDTEEHRDVNRDGNPRWFSYYGADEIADLLKSRGFGLLCLERVVPGSRGILHFLALKP